MSGIWIFIIIVFCLIIMAVMFAVLFVYDERTLNNSNVAGDQGFKISEIEPFLSKYFPFYNTLNNRLKRKFNKRLVHFIKTHSFEGREELIVTNEAKMLISAAAIHLTFGLKDFKFRDFPQIILYPGIFYSPFTRTHNKGETNPHGVMVFSWKHLKEGFATTADHINLGYHEFAHALMLEESSDVISDRGYRLFSDSLMHDHISQIARSLNIYREYAFTNKMEFFAVSAETFLEAPEFLYEKCPPIYDIMSRVLRQDPVRKQYGLRFFNFSNE